MKIPKKTKRFCPYCKKHTEQKVLEVGTGIKRGAMARGGKTRVHLRGLNRGFGNHGRFSKKPIGKYKRKTKTTKKTNLVYQCSECKKKKYQKKGKRTGKLQIE